MSTSEPDLVHEVRGLKRKVTQLPKQLDQPVGESDLSIPQFCAKHSMSRALFYKMKKRGRAPRTIECGGLIRITPEADREWEQRWGSGDPAAAAESEQDT